MKIITVLAVLFVLMLCIGPKVYAEEKTDLSGKLGLSFWWDEDPAKRSGIGMIYWLNSSLGIEPTIDINTNAGGYAGKFKVLFQLLSNKRTFLDLAPVIFIRYNNIDTNYNNIITLAPGIWLILEIFPFSDINNVSLGIGGGMDYNYVITNHKNGSTSTDNYLTTGSFSLVVRYYF